MTVDSCEPIATIRGKVVEELGLSFDDVLLRPRLGVLSSRSEASTSTFLWPSQMLETPIIGAPMAAVMGYDMAAALLKSGAAAILHRFQSVSDQVHQWQYLRDFPALLCAVGYDMDRMKALYDAGCKHFYLDVAHGHAEEASRTLRRMYSYGHAIKVMAGSVATGDGAQWLADSGASAISVGIGPGSVCTTREVTGFGVPLLTSLLEVAEAVEWAGVTVVCNGGIRSSGDIVKALAAGADTAMIGRLFAGTPEAPGNGRYWGMASKRVNGHRQPEGIDVPVGLTNQRVGDIVERLVWGIKSGISYGGATDIQTLRENALFQRVAPGVAVESGVR